MDKHCLRELSLLTAFYKKNRSHDLNSSPLAHDQLNPNQLDLECNMFKHDACISQLLKMHKYLNPVIKLLSLPFTVTFSSIVCRSVFFTSNYINIYIWRTHYCHFILNIL
jgi:hypothetical protein